MRVPLTRELAEGSRWPRVWGWPWGLAWRDHSSCHAVVMPIPLNLIVGALRRLYYAILAGVRWHEFERAKASCRYFENRYEKITEEVRELHLWKANRLAEDAAGAAAFRRIREQLDSEDPS